MAHTTTTDPAPITTYKGFKIYDSGGGKLTAYEEPDGPAVIAYSMEEVQYLIDYMSGDDNPEPDYDNQAREWEDNQRFAEQPTPYDP